MIELVFTDLLMLIMEKFIRLCLGIEEDGMRAELQIILILE